jgi:hypothetical protein
LFSSPAVAQRRGIWSSPYLLLPPDARFSLSILSAGLFVLLLAACGGDVSLGPEDPITPGQALGFDFINYVAQRLPDPDQPPVTYILQIEADGRTTAATGSASVVYAPIRFLPDDELLAVRIQFARSHFFSFSDSVYGEGSPNPFPRESIVYQIGGVFDFVTRIDDAPVPAEIAPLFEELRRLFEVGTRYQEGTPTPVASLVIGHQTQIEDREFVVIRNRDAFLNFLWRMGSIEVSVVPEVDYDAEMLVGAFLGDDADRTATIEFDSTGYFGDGTMKVRYRRTDGPVGCDPGGRPFALARLPRVEAPVEFYEDAERTVLPACP